MKRESKLYYDCNILQKCHWAVLYRGYNIVDRLRSQLSLSLWATGVLVSQTAYTDSSFLP